jgi:hypothetical protein
VFRGSSKYLSGGKGDKKMNNLMALVSDVKSKTSKKLVRKKFKAHNDIECELEVLLWTTKYTDGTVGQDIVVIVDHDGKKDWEESMMIPVTDPDDYDTTIDPEVFN